MNYARTSSDTRGTCVRVSCWQIGCWSDCRDARGLVDCWNAARVHLHHACCRLHVYHASEEAISYVLDDPRRVSDVVHRQTPSRSSRQAPFYRGCAEARDGA